MYFALGNTCENGQWVPKTVGCFSDRYRLGHGWVPEMVLDVQSGLLNINNILFFIFIKAANDDNAKLHK